MSIKETLDTLEVLILENRFNDFFANLEKLQGTVHLPAQIEKDSKLLKARYNSFIEKRNRGTISTDEEILEGNKIRALLFDLCEGIMTVFRKAEVETFFKETKFVEHDFLASEYNRLFYYFDTYHAKSIRLIGADDEYFTHKDLIVNYIHDDYILPFEFNLDYDKIIKKKTEESKEHNFMFFNGTNTRIIRFHATPIDDTEKKKLTLTLGPVKWYDFTVATEFIEKMLRNRDMESIGRYVDVGKLSTTGNFMYSKLSNIIVTASTILTKDGKLLYTLRSERVSSDISRFTSAIAENIRPEYDGLMFINNNNDTPIFNAVIRGVKEELSPEIENRIGIRNIKLLGITFDLDLFHPDFLLIIFIPLTYAQIMEACKRKPGKDFIEGQLRYLDFIDRYAMANVEIFEHSRWVQGGMASLFRSIEFLESIKYSPNTPMEDLLNRFD